MKDELYLKNGYFWIFNILWWNNIHSKKRIGGKFYRLFLKKKKKKNDTEIFLLYDKEFQWNVGSDIK